MSNSSIKTIHAWEPWFFLFFGIFHLHRIWALIDRESYASFWMGIRERGHNFWWRWIYIGGGSYVLFDLFAIATGMKMRADLLAKMFDVNSPYWNVVWGFFIVLGGLVFVLGLSLLKNRK